MRYFRRREKTTVLSRKRGEAVEELKINQISKRTNLILELLMGLIALCTALPVVLVIIISFSSEQSIFEKGYSFFPAELSLKGYEFFLKLGDQLVKSYGITIFVTIVGTTISLTVTALFAYVISRQDYLFRKPLTFLMLFTMLFNGGMVPAYMINTQLLHLGDSIWALILPMTINAYYIIVLRTFYRSIPMEIIEAARIDGSSEFNTFVKIVLPLSKPGIATIGLFTMITYWNDWFSGMLYMMDNRKYPVQTLLWSMQNSLEALKASSANALEYAEMARNAPTESGRMALTVLVILPILLAYPFFQKYFVKGLTIGGVKG